VRERCAVPVLDMSDGTRLEIRSWYSS